MSDFPTGLGTFMGVVTSLPANPQHLWYCFYTDNTTAPTYQFNLIYNAVSTSTYKWECIGGYPLSQQALTARTISATAANSAVPTDPISFDLPLAGDWDVVFKTEIKSTASSEINHTYAVEGTAGDPDWGVRFSPCTATGMSGFTTMQTDVTYRHTGLAAATTLSEQAWVGSANSQTVARRGFRCMPVRVI